MAQLAVLITALTFCVSAILPLILQFQIVKWSLDNDKRRRRHALKLLRELQSDRQRMASWARLLTSNTTDRKVRAAPPGGQRRHKPPTPGAGPL